MTTRLLTILIALIFPTLTIGQTDTCEYELDSLTGEKIYTRYDQPPNIGGSETTTYEYIGKNFEYPHHYADNELIVATFIVRQNGKVDQIELFQKSKNELANRNFLRLIEKVPKWNPAFCNGNPITAKHAISIRLGELGKEE